MERRHLSRLVALTLLLLALAAPAAAATSLHWTVLGTGATTPSGRQAPIGYIAITRTQEQKWLLRLDAGDRVAVGRVTLANNAVVAVFLDGLPCSSRITTTSVTRVQATLTVRLAYTRPPIGVAACVRTSTAYVVLDVSRKALGRPAPTRVVVSARART